MKQLIWLGLVLSSYAARAQTAPPAAALPAAPPAPITGLNAQPTTPTDGFDQGWAFDATPPPPLIDERSGYLRFKIGIDASGRIAAVERVAGNMSAKQARLCRQHILERFTVRRTQPDAAAATGFFTFRFRVE